MDSFSRHSQSSLTSNSYVHQVNYNNFSLEKNAHSPAITMQRKNIEFADNCIYVIGYLRAEFSSTGLKKEFERYLLSVDDEDEITQYLPGDHKQAAKKLQQQLKVDMPQYLYKVLSQPVNAYIAREMTWTLVNSYGNDIYTLKPSKNQFKQLIDAIKPREQHSVNSTKDINRYKMSPPVMVAGRAEHALADELPNLTISKIDSLNPSALVEGVKNKV